MKIVTGATIIDAVSPRPLEGQAIVIEGSRIARIAPLAAVAGIERAEIIDAAGKYVIPGLMNANVHLLNDIRLENLMFYWGRFEALILEAAQIALKNGLTTVFDTWGPRRPLMNARDAILRGEAEGSRIFCAGNIVGFEGPFSADFLTKVGSVASASVMEQVNAIWVENVGRHLMWLTPEQTAKEVRAYIAKGVNFVKFGANEHFGESAGAFLAFSPAVQAAIVDAAHGEGLTAQAHTMTVEGLRLAVEAGCDLIQHANNSGPVAIPQSTIDAMAERQTGAVMFSFTQRVLEWLLENEPLKGPTAWQTADDNIRRFIASDVPLLLGNDGGLVAAGARSDPTYAHIFDGLHQEDGLFPLATGHFAWLKAMEEKGCQPMRMLQAATINIARAYGKADDLGSLEAGKIADMLILDADPLAAAENYRAISLVLKDGRVVDRDRLPLEPLLTAPAEAPVPELADYIPFKRPGLPAPLCGICHSH